MAKLTRYTTFRDLKSDESRAKVSQAKAKKLASEFESFIISVQKEMDKKSKNSHGKNVTDALLQVCQFLHKHSVEYLIVGGTAMSLHGYYRYSTNLDGQILSKPDLDIWYNPAYKNLFKSS